MVEEFLSDDGHSFERVLIVKNCCAVLSIVNRFLWEYIVVSSAYNANFTRLEAGISFM